MKPNENHINGYAVGYRSNGRKIYCFFSFRYGKAKRYKEIRNNRRYQINDNRLYQVFQLTRKELLGIKETPFRLNDLLAKEKRR